MPARSDRGGRGGGARPAAAAQAARAPSQRQLRVAEGIRHLLAADLATGGVHDPRLDAASVTVAEVRVSPDLRHALVFAAELGRGELAPATREALEAAAPRLAGSLARRMRLKYAPRLRFVSDATFEAAARMERLIEREGDRVRAGRDGGSGADPVAGGGGGAADG